MACTNNNTTKPDVVQRPNNIYGAPQGQGGRVYNNVDYGVQGIVLHCTDMTISQYVQYLACLSQPVIGIQQETNHHYSIGSSGALNQHIDDNNISWTFGHYAATLYPTPPSPTILTAWPTLQGLNGTEVSPDVYVINILIAKSYNQGTSCLTSTGLPKDQHEKLIQLLAYLSATYDIPLDADHINWHDNIDTQACPSNECVCTDVACLLTDINTFCEEDCNTVTYSEVECADISHLLAIPNNCGNASGCLVSVPFDACCLGHLPQPGDIEQFVGCAVDATTGQTCLVKNVVQVMAPLTGDGTTINPIGLDLCAFGDWLPMYDPADPNCPPGTISTLLSIGDDGCLYQTPVNELIPGLETPITVIDTATVDLTSTGVNGHTLQADVKISTATGNILTSDGTGLFVGLDCASLTGLFDEGLLTNIYGVDVNGDCTSQSLADAVNGIICTTVIDDGAGEPMHILGRDIDLTCPVFYTPTQVVFAGLAVEDTLTVDLEMTQDPAVSPLNIITGNVRIDPAADNILMVTPDGLYVAPIQAQAGDTCLDVQVVDGLITISHIIDPKAENILQCGPDGLCVLDIIPLNTDCLNIEYNPTTREISGTINLAPDQMGVSNIAQCIAGQGFYVPRGANLIALGPLTGDGSETNPLDIDFAALDNEDLCDFGGVIPETLSLVDVIGLDANGCLRQYTGEQFIAQFLDIENGDCITVTLTDNVLTIEPIISPAIGALNNVLSCTPTGLYVPQGAGIAPQATNCIDLQLVNGVLTATPILDPDLTNQLSCNVDGLYVERGAGVIGDTTDCIQVIVANGEISATPIISGAILGVANTLSCEPGGLFVPVGAGLVAVTSDCLNVEFNTATGELTVTPIISPLIDNIIECTANGFYVPSDFIQTVTNTDCIALTVVGNELTATPIIDPDVNNLLECRATGLFANFAVLDTLCIDLELANGVLSANPIVDPKATNLLECGADGLCVEINPDVFIDSDCIEFDVTNGLVTANPILAPDQGPITNILRCLPDGLYVPVGGGITTLNGSCIELELIAGVLTAEVIIDAVTPDNAITCGPDGLYVPICCPIVEDTNTVDLTLTDPRTITADVIIDPDGTNILVANPNGLYVPPPFITAAIDSNCIDVEVVDGILTINPIISAEVDNALQCLADGFYVPECCPLVEDTTSIDLTLTGDRTISGVVIVDPDPDNILVINPDGLFVPPQFIDAVAPTQCIDLTVTDGVLTATPIISPDVENILECRVDGLFVPPGGGLIGEATECIDVDITDAVVTATPIIAGPVNGINNQLQCTPDGLFSPVDFISAVVPDQCIDVQVVDGALIITPIISPEDDNLLVCQADGLYVPPLDVVPTNCIDLEIIGTTLTANPIISVQDENAIQCLGDGLFVQECCPLVEDTASVDLTLTGLRTISADVIIDPAADNVLVVNPDGLFVPTPFITAIADHQCLDLDVTDGILTITPIIDPADDNALTCGPAGLYAPTLTAVAGNCVDVQVNNNVITVEAIISAQDNNIVQCLDDGLFAEAPIVTVADTDCINLVLNANELTANPIIAPDQAVPNVLECLPGQGLFAPEAFITNILDTQCIDIDVTDGVLSINPIISPLDDNLLVCQGDGLYVPPLTAIDTNCIDIEIVNGVITANPIISAQVENAIQCLADGFFVQECCPLVQDTVTVDLTLTGLRTISADVIIDPAADNTLVANPDGLFVPTPLVTAVDDTNCMSPTVTAGVLTVDPILDPAADNQLECLAGGLYVPPAAGLVGLDTDCLAVTIDPATGEISVDPIISGNINGVPNTLTCEATGLYVPELQTADTDCIGLDITANVLTANPIFAPDQGAVTNVAQCIPDQGIFVPAGAGLVVIDGLCVDLTITNGNILQADTIIDPDPENLVACGPNGLIATFDVLDDPCIDLDITEGVLTATPIISEDLLRANILTCGAGLFVPETEFTRLVGQTPAGGNFIDVDTDGDGATDFQFCEGFDTIESTNDCIEGGIGPEYMIRSITLVDKVLTINGAPEHTSFCQTVDSADFVLAGSPPVGITSDFLPSTLVVNNTDPCRDMSCMINYTGGMSFSVHNGVGGPPELVGQDGYEMNPVFTIDGAEQFNRFARNSGLDITMYAIDYRIDLAQQGWSGCQTLAPGETITIDSSYDLNITSNETITEIILQGGSITVFCATI